MPLYTTQFNGDEVPPLLRNSKLIAYGGFHRSKRENSVSLDVYSVADKPDR